MTTRPQGAGGATSTLPRATHILSSTRQQRSSRSCSSLQWCETNTSSFVDAPRCYRSTDTERLSCLLRRRLFLVLSTAVHVWRRRHRRRHERTCSLYEHDPPSVAIRDPGATCVIWVPKSLCLSDRFDIRRVTPQTLPADAPRTRRCGALPPSRRCLRRRLVCLHRAEKRSRILCTPSLSGSAWRRRCGRGQVLAARARRAQGGWQRSGRAPPPRSPLGCAAVATEETWAGVAALSLSRIEHPSPPRLAQTPPSRPRSASASSTPPAAASAAAPSSSFTTPQRRAPPPPSPQNRAPHTAPRPAL